MCRLFQRYDDNERIKISVSVSTERKIRVYFVFDFLEDWLCNKGAFILRQLLKQFKLAMVGYDPNNIFVFEKYSFDEWGDKGYIVTYCIPFDADKFHETNLQDNTNLKIYHNFLCFVTNLSSSLSLISIIYAST